MWSGAILLPNASRSASSAALGSAFSRSHLLSTKQAAVLVARPTPTAASRPASTPPEASITNSAASAAWKPSIISADEVRVAGRVDDGDLVLAVLERADREAERLVALLLLGLVVEVGGPVVHPAQARDRAGTKEDLLRERRLAATGVAREHDGADVGEVVALDRHRAQYLVVTRDPGVTKTGAGRMGT